MDPVEMPPGHEHGGQVTGMLVLIDLGNEAAGSADVDGTGGGRGTVPSGGGGDEAPIAGEGEGNEPPAACAVGYLGVLLLAVGAAVVNINGGLATFGAAAV